VREEYAGGRCNHKTRQFELCRFHRASRAFFVPEQNMSREFSTTVPGATLDMEI
jgi:hypothetical protein